jgi:HEAT repeat protein
LQPAFDVVREAWSEANEELRSAIVDTLFRLDGDQAVQVLDEIMNDPDPWLRIHVIELLAPLHDVRISRFIGRFLDDDDGMVREIAASTLSARC